ncbi:LOW QUALITY PROTEIN: hypothetical protein HID58_065651, partial [Brassica napus]
NLLCSSMASMVTAPSPSRSRPPPDPPPSFAVFVVVFGASPLEPPKPPDDSPLAIVQPSTAYVVPLLVLYSLPCGSLKVSCLILPFSPRIHLHFQLNCVELRGLLYHISCLYVMYVYIYLCFSMCSAFVIALSFASMALLSSI